MLLPTPMLRLVVMVCVSVCVCVYVCVYVCMYVCMYICIYIYIYGKGKGSFTVGFWGESGKMATWILISNAANWYQNAILSIRWAGKFFRPRNTFGPCCGRVINLNILDVQVQVKVNKWMNVLRRISRCSVSVLLSLFLILSLSLSLSLSPEARCDGFRV